MKAIFANKFTHTSVQHSRTAVLNSDEWVLFYCFYSETAVLYLVFFAAAKLSFAKSQLTSSHQADKKRE